MTVPDVRISRLVAHCRVPTGTSAGPALVAALGEELEAPLEQVAGQAPLHGYWLIRRLDVRTHLRADWTTGQMAGALAHAIGDGMRQCARGGRDSREVQWFPDRAAFLAAFLLDLARGHAGSRWEYDELGPLRPWHEAAISLAGAEPGVLQGALLRLSAAELDELGERVEGDRLIAAVAGEGASSGPVFRALRELRGCGRLGVTGSTGLVLALTAARDPTVDLAEVAGPALDVAGLVRLLSASGARSGAVLAAVAAGRWADVVALAGPTDAILALLRWSGQARAELVEALATTPPATGSRLHTRFGGAFVLLPLLADLWSWDAATATWPRAGGVGPDRLAKLAVLAAALGSARFAAVLDDPALRLALGVPEDLDLRTWLGELDPAPFAHVSGLSLDEPVDSWTRPPVAGFLGVAASAVLRDLGSRLPGMRAASPAYLWRNVLDVEAWVRVAENQGLVELGQVPLGVLLSLTGLSRTGFVVEGAGERRWTLTSRC